MKQRNHFSKIALGVTTLTLLTAAYSHAEPVRKEIQTQVQRTTTNHNMVRETKASVGDKAMQRQHNLTVDGKTAARNVAVDVDQETQTINRSATTSGPNGSEFSNSQSVTVPDVNRTVESELDTEAGTYSRTVTTEVNGQTTSVTRDAAIGDSSAEVSNARTVNGKTVSAEKSAELDGEADTLTTSTTVTGPDGKQYSKDTVRSVATGEE